MNIFFHCLMKKHLVKMNKLLAIFLIYVSSTIYCGFSLADESQHKPLVKRYPPTYRARIAIRSLNVSKPTSNSQGQRSQSKFLIDTAECKILATDLFNTKINKYFDNFDRKSLVGTPYCLRTKEYKQPLVGSDGNSIFIIKEALPFYRSNSSTQINCSFSPFRQVGRDKLNHIRIGNRTKFTNRFNVSQDTEFVLVECSEMGQRIYTDAHAFVPVKTLSNERHNQNSSEKVPSILVFGMNALSRVNFHRQMPRISVLLQKLGFVEYYGYNKLASSTYPNLVPFLTGKNTSELSELCLQNQSSFETCPFIWNKYEQLNYLTSYAEEYCSYLGTFHLDRVGFNSPPTDYYYYPFDKFANLKIGHTSSSYNSDCLGFRRSTDVFLSYVTKFINSLKNHRFFSFFWEVSLSHDDLNLPRTGEDEHIALFEEMKRIELLKTSVVAFISDHGMRSGEFLKTDEGYMEDRLPLFMVSFPRWFRHRYKLAYANFLRNSRRLTTHFDAHEMLNDLVNLSLIEDTEITRRTNELNASALPRGISLFLSVPDKRTCKDAAIEDDYCTCNVELLAKEMDDMVKSSAKYLVDHINDLVSEYKNCSKLTLKNVMSARRTLSRQGVTKITMIVKTEPGGGEFQGLIEIINGKENVVGTVSLINHYNNQSDCLKDPKVKFRTFNFERKNRRLSLGKMLSTQE